MAKAKKKWVIWVIILVAVAAVAAGVLVVMNQSKKAAALLAVPDIQYKVERGTLEKTVTAKGMLEAEETTVTMLPDGLKVEKLLVQAGDQVPKGTPLARLTSDSISTQLLYVGNKLEALDKKLGKSETAGNITAPAQGRLKYLAVKSGDDVAAAMKEYGYLAILSADGLMKFTVETDLSLTLGDRYTVKFDGGRAWGSVVKAVEGGYLMTVPDDRAPYGGTAEVYDGTTLIGSGTLDVNMPIKVYGYTGVIDKIGYRINESVPARKNMFSIKNARSNTTYQKKYYERTTMSNRLNELITFSQDPVVYAPFDCVVSEIVLAEGVNVGKVEVCDKSSEAFKLAAADALKLVINVDELDISKITLGQTAQVDLTAYDGEKFVGTVARISKVGKKQNSISTYPVDLTMEADPRLFAGMNATATILVERAENLLLVPMEAVEEGEEGQYVYVLDAAQQKTRKNVTTGRSDGTNVEITSGLTDGDVVVYPDYSSSEAIMGLASSTAVTSSEG